MINMNFGFDYMLMHGFSRIFTKGGYYVVFQRENLCFWSTHTFLLFCAPQAADRIPVLHHRPIYLASTSWIFEYDSSEDLVDCCFVVKSLVALNACNLRPKGPLLSAFEVVYCSC